MRVFSDRPADIVLCSTCDPVIAATSCNGQEEEEQKRKKRIKHGLAIERVIVVTITNHPVLIFSLPS